VTTAHAEGSDASLTKVVEVACTPERAFELFTTSIGEWWPLPTHSVYGSDAASVSMGGIGQEIVETSISGARTVWGTITAWEAGRLLRFTWHPGIDLQEATDVEVRFTPTPHGTRVRLEHRGWEKRRDPAAKRAQYESGWGVVLDHLARAVTQLQRR
jgi:uncharacterized protein YndB with AHSA1/START domain